MTKRPSLSAILGQSKEETSTPRDEVKRGRPKEEESLSSRLERGEYKQLKAIVPAQLHRRVKVAAAQHDMEISKIVEEALEAWLTQNQPK